MLRALLICAALMVASGCAVLDRIGAGCLEDSRDSVVDFIDGDIEFDELRGVIEACAADLGNVALVKDNLALAVHDEINSVWAPLSWLTINERLARAEQVMVLLARLE